MVKAKLRIGLAVLFSIGALGIVFKAAFNYVSFFFLDGISSRGKVC